MNKRKCRMMKVVRLFFLKKILSLNGKCSIFAVGEITDVYRSCHSRSYCGCASVPLREEVDVTIIS